MADEVTGESRSSSSTILTAGIIIIGDEILKGHTKDVNSYFLVKRFWSLGIKVCKISVVSDEEDQIANEVKTFSKHYTYVITTGGIGPTHDDVTINSVAKAFGEEVVKNDKIVDVLEKVYCTKKCHLNDAHLKMAMLPSSAELIHSSDAKENPFPVVRVHNVYIFPGVPHFVEKDFAGIEYIFSQNSKTEFHICKIYLSIDEAEIVQVLNEINEKFKGVQVGSYPDFCSREYQVKLTLESVSFQEVQNACQCLLSKLPAWSVVKVEGLDMVNGLEGVKTLK